MASEFEFLTEDASREASYDLFVPNEGRDRRRHPRYGGDPVEVALRWADDLGEPFSGVVIDRSRGGLGLSLDRAVERGRVLEVRRLDRTDLPWTRIEARNCWRTGPYYEVGCEFVTPPPDLELLFG